MGVDSATVQLPESFFKRLEKMSLARDAARNAGCEISILEVRPSKPRVEETAIIVAFFANTPHLWTSTSPLLLNWPGSRRAFLSANDDPQWHVLGR